MSIKPSAIATKSLRSDFTVEVEGREVKMFHHKTSSEFEIGEKLMIDDVPYCVLDFETWCGCGRVKILPRLGNVKRVLK